jgi:hypothetical protein
MKLVEMKEKLQVDDGLSLGSLGKGRRLVGGMGCEALDGWKVGCHMRLSPSYLALRSACFLIDVSIVVGRD